jgi:hypothetical protein
MFTITLLTGTVIQASPTYKSKCTPKQSYKAPSPQAAPSTTSAQPTPSLPVCDPGFICVIGDATFNEQTEQATTVPENCGIDELSDCSFECTAENCSNGGLKSGLSDLAMATCNAAISTSEFLCPQPCDPATVCKFGTDVFHLIDGQANVPLSCLAEELPDCSAECSADNC